jgi:aminopeptidase YwaD
MTEAEGLRLVKHAGNTIRVVSRCERIPSTGSNVVATKGRADRRIVVFAHIDSRIGTPGANDNASGVTALLLLAQLLEDYAGSMRVELVAMNGEDYYSNPGEQLYLAANAAGLMRSSLASTSTTSATCSAAWHTHSMALSRWFHPCAGCVFPALWDR